MLLDPSQVKFAAYQFVVCSVLPQESENSMSVIYNESWEIFLKLDALIEQKQFKIPGKRLLFLKYFAVM